jgi:gamma-glutamyltranspeptidase/glutathione hydrolase
LLDSKLSGGAVGPLPASTTFGALDAGGRAVVCGTSLGNLFGTGRIAANTGILLAVSAARAPAPLQSLAILVNRSDRVFFGLAGGSGQEGAPIAAAAALYQGQFGKTQIATPEPGRANVIACGKGLPGGAPSCVWSADPRGNGAALGVTTGAN